MLYGCPEFCSEYWTQYSHNVFHRQWISAFCRWRNIDNFQIECRYPKCVSWITLSRTCCYFPVRRSRLVFVYTFDFKKFTMFFKIKYIYIYDQVQKLVRPWPDQPDRFRRACKDNINFLIEYLKLYYWSKYSKLVYICAMFGLIFANLKKILPQSEGVNSVLYM